MKDHIQLRPARQEDAAALQCLNADVLGYDCSLSDTQKQLRRLLHCRSISLWWLKESGSLSAMCMHRIMIFCMQRQ